MRLWPVTNQAMPSAGYAYANQSFDSLDELESVLFQRCKLLCLGKLSPARPADRTDIGAA
ncbi:hypothetical protein [Nostoc commune]|uniref:hypothetical protein n=1 Tax=Nostoc commune TaxID=1178 RepID=UPI0015E806C9|nr:hypothetical protein [Nostoc commune]